MSILEEIIEIPVEHEQNVFGQFDAFAKKIDFAVRKSAHACEYAALSVLFFVNYKKTGQRQGAGEVCLR